MSILRKYTAAMTELFEKAIAQLKTLPAEEQDASHKPLSPVEQMIWVQPPNLHRIVQL